MKVLFAVSNENISESIVKKYQQEYKEIISYKNVYYFNAILKEIQKDKTYDRIVISEDLEAYTNNNYDVIDKFIFEKLDSISDEAADDAGNDTPIILICTDRRTRSDSMLNKLFGIGIYSALIGQDRSIEQVCSLIYKPRTKKEAKMYYKLDTDDVNYQTESEEDVSEQEIQNILTYYKRIGKNDDKYVESFNNLANQYTDAQLRIIINFLPLSVRAVLEAKSPKYQEIITFHNPGKSSKTFGKSGKDKKSKSKKQPEELEVPTTILENIPTNAPEGKVVIPSAVNTEHVVKIEEERPEPLLEKQENEPVVEFQEEEVEPVKRGRGRPPKAKPVTEEEAKPKRGRGRPPKKVVPEVQELEEQEEPVNIFGLGEEQEETTLPGLEEEQEPPVSSVNFETEQKNYSNMGTSFWGNSTIQTPNMQEQQVAGNYESNTIQNAIQNTTYQSYTAPYQTTNSYSKEVKTVAFIGTTKNGTSFLINNLAELFSKEGIKTAILDATQNKNDYYIYTKNEENLRKTAMNCIEDLRRGLTNGIKVNKNLDVYTTVPGNAQSAMEDCENILRTLQANYSVILIDCDFGTNLEYIRRAEELYLVQSMDILTIQPLTTYLRELKAKGALQEEKLRIVINKTKQVRSLTAMAIIGGMAFYNEPAMSFMTELFNRDQVKYCTVPLDEQVYVKYLEGLVNCEISLNGYSKTFMESLTNLGNMVYPLLNKEETTSKIGFGKKKKEHNGYVPNAEYNRTTSFSSKMTDTLNYMKNKYN